jgi:hypothetical protein
VPLQARHHEHQSIHVTALQRFLGRAEEPTVEYRAVRRLEAHNAKFNQSGWMVVMTEFDRTNGMRYQIMSEGGSPYICRKVLRAALDGEQKMWTAREPQKASLSEENYTFEDHGVAAGEGQTVMKITPRRKDVLLVEGSIYVHPDDGELRRIEGKLSKSPSMWTRRVDIVRRYERIDGARVPVSIESTAQVIIAGHSTFKMTYEYETINGKPVR